MKTPSSSKEITKVWLEHVLGEHVTKTRPGASLSVLSFTVNRGTNPGDGFNSELARVDVEASVREAASSTDDKIVYHLMAKFLSSDPGNREINRRTRTDMREYLMYSEVIRDLNELQAAKAPEEPQISIPDLIYGKCTEKAFVLLMENIKFLGYETNDKYKGLDYHHLKAALDQIARVHALSYAFSRSTNFPKKYACIHSAREHLAIFKTMAPVMYENCGVFLKSLSDKEDVLRRLELSTETLTEKYLAAVPEEEDTMACLCHGDFWNNNLMYRYKDSAPGETHREIESLKIIDWGACVWGSPVLDLQYLLHTSTSGAVRKAHLEEFLHQYHSTFTSLTAKLGYPVANWDFDQFMSKWKKTLVIGFTLGSALTQGTLSASNPMSREPKPSVLDKPICLPVRAVVYGLKLGMAKLLTPLMFRPFGEPIMRSVMRQFLKPIGEELASGKNKAMNTRLLDLISEADESGLFDAESE